MCLRNLNTCAWLCLLNASLQCNDNGLLIGMMFIMPIVVIITIIIIVVIVTLFGLALSGGSRGGEIRSWPQPSTLAIDFGPSPPTKKQTRDTGNILNFPLTKCLGPQLLTPPHTHVRTHTGAHMG